MGKLKKSKKQSGQVMLLTVIILSGTLLAILALVGFLMLHKIRQSTDITNSTKSVLAADSGIEWELFRYFKTEKYGECILSSCPADYPWGSVGGSCPTDILAKCTAGEYICLSNCAYATTTIETGAAGDFIKSIGKAGNTARAFQMMLQGATPTLP